MAKSMSHKFGEMLGSFFERAMRAPIAAVAAESGLYFDTAGKRPARKTKKVTWSDANGSSHDLDYVLERGGSLTRIGAPVAFIELAWRRYTKHSKNKAQEIAGAILPIIEKHRDSAPFYGVVLGGDFTENSIRQLRESGFEVLYFPYDDLVEFFKDAAGIDISFGEHTSESEFRSKIRAFKTVPASIMNNLPERFTTANACKIQAFVSALRQSIGRRVSVVRVLPLHGNSHDFTTVADALSFISGYEEARTESAVARYEIAIRYSNNSKVEGVFTDKEHAIDFLNKVSSI